jgi:hypothetical protein
MNDAGMFSQRDAQRIANTVLAHERRGTDHPPIKYKTLRGGASSALKLAYTLAPWPQDTAQNLLVLETSDPPNEAPSTPPAIQEAWNKWSYIGAGEYVVIGEIAGTWYVVERPNYGIVLVGSYQGSWANGGAIASVKVVINGDDFFFPTSNWLSPISGNGGSCVIGPSQDGWTLLNFNLTSLKDYSSGSCVLGSEGGELKWFDTVICT